jgi:hypothetical protein
VKSVGEWLVLMAWVAMIFVLVRPGSQGPSFVTDIGKSFASVIGASTGGGTWASG